MAPGRVDARPVETLSYRHSPARLPRRPSSIRIRPRVRRARWRRDPNSRWPLSVRAPRPHRDCSAPWQAPASRCRRRLPSVAAQQEETGTFSLPVSVYEFIKYGHHIYIERRRAQQTAENHHGHGCLYLVARRIAVDGERYERRADVSAVIMMGRRRSTEPSAIRSPKGMPSAADGCSGSSEACRCVAYAHERYEAWHDGGNVHLVAAYCQGG